jgi:hypothetical protein
MLARGPLPGKLIDKNNTFAFSGTALDSLGLNFSPPLFILF